MADQYDMSGVHSANLKILKEVDRICRKYKTVSYTHLDVYKRQLVGLITRRSLVQIRPPQPPSRLNFLNSTCFFVFTRCV